MTFKTPFNTTPFNYSVPASETPQGKERIRAYHEALGRFIDMFSRAEAAVEYVLRHYAETSTRVALVIFQNAGISISCCWFRPSWSTHTLASVCCSK